MMVELAVTAGPHAGRTFQFTEHAAFLVGRSSQANFSLPEKDPHVSRLHFLIEVNPPLCRLRDMGGVNGTVVNGSKVTQTDLKDGDRISLGVSEITVRLHTTPTAEVPTVALPPAVPEGADLGRIIDALLPQPAAIPTPATVTFSPPPGTHTLPEDTPPAIPDYRIECVLGRGGMGIVYRAVHLASGDPVAVKTILPQVRVTTAGLMKFIREADVLRRLDHPGIVKFRDSGIAGDRVWFAMEYVPGADAQATTDVVAPLAVGRAVGWMVQVLEALAHAHGKGFVHRDVKPSNLLVASGTGSAEVVKLADFGLARAYEASPLSGLTLTGVRGGTPAFMPPEQVLDMRSVKPAADQYAAAASLYRLLSGKHIYPPSATVEELFTRILQTDPVPLTTHRTDLPTGLVDAIHRALRRDAAARFPDCTAFANSLKPFAG